MPPTARRERIEKLTDIQQLSPGARLGEMPANLGFLVEDQTDQAPREVEDERLPEVMESHRADLARRQAEG
jgi:hypothetical protein